MKINANSSIFKRKLYKNSRNSALSLKNRSKIKNIDINIKNSQEFMPFIEKFIYLNNEKYFNKEY